MSQGLQQPGSWFQRIILPGLVFKGVVIGGGYATGRELVEFFFASGPLGALYGILFSMLIWSLVCAASFAFAQAVRGYDYRTFFKELLGPFWVVFELSYLALIVLIIAVIAAAAGTTGATLLGWPGWLGTGLLMAAIVGVCTFGSAGVERMFKVSSLFLYVIYALFVVLALSQFGDRTVANLASGDAGGPWASGGLLYASYNVVGVVAVLPFLIHQSSRRDAIVSGLLAGPLAMLPGLLFFLSMIAFYPAIGEEPLPSNFLLARIGLGWFTLLFNLMLFVALLETGVSGVNAITDRVADAWRARRHAPFPRFGFLALSTLIVFGSGVVATQVGLIPLIAQGYGAFAYVMLAIFIVPLLTIGMWRLSRQPSRAGEPASMHKQS
jgi:uncharacterized membrane protein YkvI